MNISNLIDNTRTTQSNAPSAIDSNKAQQEFGKAESAHGGGCPFAGKQNDTVKEKNTIPDLLQAINNILTKLLSS